MIDGVRIESLRQIVDERGKVMHMLRNDSPIFENFGEIYFSFINPCAVKAWKLHKKITMNLAVPYGKIKLVLFDGRPESVTYGKVQELLIGQDNYCLVKVPPMIWNGFQGITDTVSIVANCATYPHNPDEVERTDLQNEFIPYKW